MTFPRIRQVLAAGAAILSLTATALAPAEVARLNAACMAQRAAWVAIQLIGSAIQPSNLKAPLPKTLMQASTTLAS